MQAEQQLQEQTPLPLSSSCSEGFYFIYLTKIKPKLLKLKPSACLNYLSFHTMNYWHILSLTRSSKIVGCD